MQHEPKRITKDIKLLARKIREDADFSSLVFAMRDLMHEHGAAPNRMRAALRFILHEDSWRRYRGRQSEVAEVEETRDADGADPMEV